MSENTSPNRLILGEGERCGLPISAPVVTRIQNPHIGDLRWVQRLHSFALQRYEPTMGREEGWVDVPCVVDSSEEG